MHSNAILKELNLSAFSQFFPVQFCRVKLEIICLVLRERDGIRGFWRGNTMNIIYKTVQQFITPLILFNILRNNEKNIEKTKNMSTTETLKYLFS